jgi:hypothetical protein
LDGLLLQLLGDSSGPTGRWFWTCFEPLRQFFDRHFWIVDNPWMGAPDAFFATEGEPETIAYEGSQGTSAQLWRPGAIGRWAEQFSEEFIDLWAIDPADDPAHIAASYSQGLSPEDSELFTEQHAVVRLIYTDSCSWEIFARDSSLLALVERHAKAQPASLRCFSTLSQNRSHAFRKIGWRNWPA